jgi:hypothetical protein
MALTEREQRIVDKYRNKGGSNTEAPKEAVSPIKNTTEEKPSASYSKLTDREKAIVDKYKAKASQPIKKSAPPVYAEQPSEEGFIKRNIINPATGFANAVATGVAKGTYDAINPDIYVPDFEKEKSMGFKSEEERQQFFEQQKQRREALQRGEKVAPIQTVDTRQKQGAIEGIIDKPTGFMPNHQNNAVENVVEGFSEFIPSLVVGEAAIPAKVIGAAAKGGKILEQGAGKVQKLLNKATETSGLSYARGGLEGATYAGTQGEDVGLGALAGGAGALIGDAAAHAVTKYSPAIIKKVTDRFTKNAPSKKLYDADGAMTPEFQQAVANEQKILDEVSAGKATETIPEFEDDLTRFLVEKQAAGEVLDDAEQAIVKEHVARQEQLNAAKAPQVAEEVEVFPNSATEFVFKKQKEGKELSPREQAIFDEYQKTKTQKQKEEPFTQGNIKPEPEPLGGTGKTEKEIAQDLKKKRNEELAAEIDVDPAIRGAARELEIDVNPSAYSRSQRYRDVEQGIASLPASELNIKSINAVNKLSKKADEFIETYGGKIDKGEADKAIEKRSSEIVHGLSEKSDELYQQINKTIPSKTEVKVPKLKEYLEERAEDFGGINKMPSAEAKTLRDIQDGKLTYIYIDQLRKDLGRAAYGKGEDVFKNAETAILKKMERLLLEDQRAVTEQFGQQETFDSARALISQRKKIEDKLKNAFGKTLQRDIIPVLSSSLQDLSQKGSAKKFNVIIDAIPEEMRTSAIATAMGDVFSKGRNKETMSIDNFSNWYTSLKRNDSAYKILKQYFPDAAIKRLNAIGTLATGIARAQKSYITTGKSIAVKDLFADLEGNVSKIAKATVEKGGLVAADTALGTGGLLSLLGFVGNKFKNLKKPAERVADELLASKKFADTLEAYYVKGEKFSRADASILEKTATYKKWYDLQTKETQTELDAKGFLRWLTAPEKEEE